MPWPTMQLKALRELNRDQIVAQLNSSPLVPNSALRVLADANAALAFLNLLAINWDSQQFLPDTAVLEWLDRHAQIWVNGRKMPNFAVGSITVVPTIAGTVLPSGSPLQGTAADGSTVNFQTTEEATIGSPSTPINIAAIDAGADGNIEAGNVLTFSPAIAGINANATVVSLSGGTDVETDVELRARILERIRNPPMGGAAADYVNWALSYPGVTRAWCSPLEQGLGTVTLRFMMDDLRATTTPITNGFPLASDVQALQEYLDNLRPVAVADFFVAAPVPQPINFQINNSAPDDAGTKAAVGASVAAMLAQKASPAQAVNGIAQPATTIYAAWVSDAILNTAGMVSFDLVMSDQPPISNGSLAVLGTVTWNP